MKQWLLKSIGVGGDITSRVDDLQWMLARPMAAWIGLALLVPVTWFIIRRHRRNLPHVGAAARWVLNFCRVAVLLLLVMVLAGPYVRIEEQVTRKPVLAVLVDESLSMTLPAGPFEADELAAVARASGFDPTNADHRTKLQSMSRLMLVDAAMTASREKLITPLEERFDIQAYRFARRSRVTELGRTLDAPLESSDADESNLGDAIGKALDESAGRVMAGMVVFTDGRWTTGADPVSHFQRIPGMVGGDASPAPLWAVPVGAVNAMADVALLDALTPGRVAQGDSATIIATIDSQGFDKRPTKVKLLDSAGQVLDTLDLTLASAQRQQAHLKFEAVTAGPTMLTVRVEPLGEEQVTANNEMTVMIDVDPERLRVLYVEGWPRWDFRFLDHAIRRDKGLETTIVMEAALGDLVKKPDDAQAAAAQAALLPQDAAGFAQYKVVVLGDVSPALLTPRIQRQLAMAVEEEGLGLIVQAGSRHMPHRFADGPLADILPVHVQPPAGAAAADVNADGGALAPAYAPFQMNVTATGAIHPIFRLYDAPERNRQIWSRMPTYYWANHGGEVRKGATLLAQTVSRSEGDARHPLMAVQFAGRGRVLYIGTDSTYRWRRNIGSHLFYRFWGQAIRFVSGSAESRGGESSWMEVYPTRVEPGEQVTIELYAVNRDSEPIDVPEVQLKASGNDMVDTVSLMNVGQPGRFKGMWKPMELGQYSLAYIDGRGKSVTGTVQVAGSNRELRRPDVDRDVLAALGEASGGGMIEFDQIHQLPKLLKGEPRTETTSHEAEIWDNWLVLLLLVTLYCMDVGVRRVMGLN